MQDHSRRLLLRQPAVAPRPPCVPVRVRTHPAADRILARLSHQPRLRMARTACDRLRRGLRGRPVVMFGAGVQVRDHAAANQVQEQVPRAPVASLKGMYGFAPVVCNRDAHHHWGVMSFASKPRHPLAHQFRHCGGTRSLERGPTNSHLPLLPPACGSKTTGAVPLRCHESFETAKRSETWLFFLFLLSFTAQATLCQKIFQM